MQRLACASLLGELGFRHGERIRGCLKFEHDLVRAALRFENRVLSAPRGLDELDGGVGHAGLEVFARSVLEARSVSAFFRAADADDDASVRPSHSEQTLAEQRVDERALSGTGLADDSDPQVTALEPLLYFVEG